MRRTILYIGWVGFGNHGDDLCYDLFVQNMTAKATSQGKDLEIKALFPANFNEYSLVRLNPDLVVLGAGSLFEPVYLKPLILAQQHAIPTAIWGSGYDSMLPSPIDPTLIDPDSAFMIRQVVQNADIIGVRGPYTMEMLSAIGADHPELHISGDPGLLLKEQESEVGLEDLVVFEKPLLTVNWGTAANKVLGGDEGKVAQDLVEVLSKLTDEYTIAIYPVWPKDINACQKLHALIENRKTVYCLKRVPTVAELIDLYKRSKLTINMKLHANVFSAALNVPFVCLAYRMKGWDFARSLNWADFTISFSEGNRVEKIGVAFQSLSNDYAVQKARLAEQTNDYKTRLSMLTNKIIALLP